MQPSAPIRSPRVILTSPQAATGGGAVGSRSRDTGLPLHWHIITAASRVASRCLTGIQSCGDKGAAGGKGVVDMMGAAMLWRDERMG